MRYNGAIFMSSVSTILCNFWWIASRNRRKAVYFIDFGYIRQVKNWRIEELKWELKNWSEQSLHVLQSWLFWTLPLEWLGFGFRVITIYLWFVTSYYLFELIWIVVEHCQHHLSDVHAPLFCSKFGNFGIIFAALLYMPKTSVKID